MRRRAGSYLTAVLALGLVACGDDAVTGGAGGQGGAGPAAPYTIEALVNARITSDPAQPSFQRATADVDLVSGPFAEVLLDVALDTTCYPFEKWEANPPPAGQNWPADCDAFDRNFEVSLHDPAAPEGTPGIELVRAITPFGGPMAFQADLTDLANARPGPYRLEILITTWSDGAGMVSGSNGGWNVSATMRVTPGTPPRNVLTVQSLFYGSDGDRNGPGPLAFDVPEGTQSGRIEYRVTGHGGPNTGPGCSGPAEEFCRHDHVIFLDGAEVATVLPQRTDCELGCTDAHYGPVDTGFDYCLENPCGLPASVRASRANWCPGSVTPPLTFDVGLAAGPHDFAWQIPELVDGGSWSVSVTYFAYGAD